MNATLERTWPVQDRRWKESHRYILFPSTCSLEKQKVLPVPPHCSIFLWHYSRSATHPPMFFASSLLHFPLNLFLASLEYHFLLKELQGSFIQTIFLLLFFRGALGDKMNFYGECDILGGHVVRRGQRKGESDGGR